MSKVENKQTKFKGKIYRNMYCPVTRRFMDMRVIENNGYIELKFGDFFTQQNIRLKDRKNSVQKEIYEKQIGKVEADGRGKDSK